MLIIKAHPAGPQRKAALKAAVSVLKRGGVVAFPTETVYGMGCDPRDARAVRRVYAMKGRGESKPLQLIAGSLAQVKKIAQIDRANARVIKKRWPGPLTLLLPLRKGVKLALRISPKRTIGIRVSSHSFVRELAKRFGSPIAATSANRSGRAPAASGRGAARAFKDDPKPDLLLDFGSIPKRKPTTVARIRKDGSVAILRQGGIRLPPRV
jgi:L-threonylcarbamoyladenylate synthase